MYCLVWTRLEYNWCHTPLHFYTHIHITLRCMYCSINNILRVNKWALAMLLDGLLDMRASCLTQSSSSCHSKIMSPCCECTFKRQRGEWYRPINFLFKPLESKCIIFKKNMWNYTFNASYIFWWDSIKGLAVAFILQRLKWNHWLIEYIVNELYPTEIQFLQSNWTECWIIFHTGKYEQLLRCLAAPPALGLSLSFSCCLLLDSSSNMFNKFLIKSQKHERLPSLTHMCVE